jgi:hypothetical protein
MIGWYGCSICCRWIVPERSERRGLTWDTQMGEWWAVLYRASIKSELDELGELGEL